MKMTMMKYRSLFAFATMLVIGVVSAGAQGLSVPSSGSETVTLNDRIGKNQFVWVSDAPLENIKGTAQDVSGSFTMDPHNLASIRGTISAQVRSMKTGNATRDGHLVSSEWLDASRYPVISFAISSVDNIQSSGNSATGIATGTFTMHGVSRRVNVPIRLTYVTESAKTRERAPGDLVMVTADFSLSLKDFNIAGTEGAVGSKVGETIKITAQLFGNGTKHGAS
jgi:polyisoprenoid-binding protein YceI